MTGATSISHESRLDKLLWSPKANRILFGSLLGAFVIGEPLAYIYGQKNASDAEAAHALDPAVVQRANSAAHRYQEGLEESISDPGSHVPGIELEGVVTYRALASRRGTIPQFRLLHNPILLSWDTTRSHTPDTDSELNGAWVAYQTTDPVTGRVEIDPVPFDARTMHFAPADSAGVLRFTPVRAVMAQVGAHKGDYIAVSVPPPGQPVDYADRPGVITPIG